MDVPTVVIVPFVDEGQVIGHEDVSEHRQYVCPLLGSARCDWLGTRANILQHCSSQHSDFVLQNPTTFHHDITQASSHTYLLTAFQVLFLLYTKVCLASGRIYHSVRHLGTSEEAAKYKYNLDIKRGNICLRKRDDVAPQGCLAMQEPTSMVLNTNSLLVFLGGFDGTIFTVTVKLRVNDAAEELPWPVMCAACGAAVPVLLYRDEKGWRCERCVPSRCTCKNQGCTYTEINMKCEKHEKYYCKLRTRCVICSKAVSQGSLFVHYDFAPEVETYRAGSTWRVTQTNWRSCLVSSVASNTVCRYMLNNSSFIFVVYQPMSSERLSEFLCTIQITLCDTEHMRTYTPVASYTDNYDWRIEVKSKDFPSWCGEFDICVDITTVNTESLFKS